MPMLATPVNSADLVIGMVVAISAVETATMAMPKLKEMLNEERGQALMLTALSFSMLLAFMALALDTGVLFRAKRRLQVAADAAAVAGTLDYLYNGSVTTAKAAAKAASSQNGFTDGSGGVSVTGSAPPADGPDANNPAFLAG